MTPARCRIPKAAIPALLLLALTLGAQAQVVEDSIEVETRWVGSLCYNPTANVVYGCGEQPGAFFAIDCSTNEVVASIPLPGALHVSSDASHRKAYCLFHNSVDSDSVLVVDGETHSRVGAFALDWGVSAVWDPVGGSLYVACGEVGQVAVVDCSRDSVVGLISVGGFPRVLCLNQERRKLYAVCVDGGAVAVVDLPSRRLERSIPVGRYPYDGLYASGPRKFYCGGDAGVTVISGTSDSVIGNIPVPGLATVRSLAFSDSTWMVAAGVWDAVSVDADLLYFIDSRTDSLVGSLPSGKDPEGILWSPLSDMFLTANRIDRSATVVKGDGSEVLKTLTVGRSPYTWEVCPDMGRIYLGHLSSYFVYSIRDTAAGIEDLQRRLEDSGCGMQAAPNPFSAWVRIDCSPVDCSGPAIVFAADGRLVAELQSEGIRAGRVSFEWNGRDSQGKEVPAGVYMVVLKGDSMRDGVRMVKMR